MKRIIFCLMVLTAFTAIPAFGAGDHGHGGHDDHGHGHDQPADLSEAKIIEKASGYVARMVEKGKLDASWRGISPTEARENDHHEWMVTFNNPKEEDPEKQTLYMFLTPSGKYIAANFTGD